MQSIFKKYIYKLYIKYIKLIENYEWNKDKIEFKEIGINSRISAPYKLYNKKYITIGSNFSTLHNTRIEAFDEYYGVKFFPEIKIGDNVTLNSDCHIGCINRVEIGNNVLIASRVYISDHNHGYIDERDLDTYPYLRPLYSKGSVVIEDNVWVGEGVCILPGVTIGRNSIIGANSVVNKDVPPNSVVAGVPARIIKYL